MTNTFDMSMSQVKTIPVPNQEPRQSVSKNLSVKKQGTRYATLSIENFLSNKIELLLKLPLTSVSPSPFSSLTAANVHSLDCKGKNLTIAYDFQMSINSRNSCFLSAYLDLNGLGHKAARKTIARVYLISLFKKNYVLL